MLLSNSTFRAFLDNTACSKRYKNTAMPEVLRNAWQVFFD